MTDGRGYRSKVPSWSELELRGLERVARPDLVRVGSEARRDVFDRWADGEFDIAPNAYERASRINDPGRWTGAND
ncbi:hypothetical protein G9U51_08420 [Calidifontibacter sp. DB0510]|uniref:Uncharacterized protein n=1 Tax=Metallococcus carri TaxID=1656884 RepID=A0A967EA14_9MICO|nr:hypothetical protein [Metallococcus carri]